MSVCDWGTSYSKGRLLCSVSTFALLAALCGPVRAEAADQLPGVWSLELQGGYDFDETGSSQSFLPSAGIPDTSIEPRNGYEGAGKVTCQPAASPFSYALNVRYGRSRNVSRDFSDVHPTSFGTFDQSASESRRSSHTVVDFEVGKDVGLGLFGTGVTTAGGGLRYAHFDADTRGSFATSSKYTNGAGRFKLSRRADVFGPRVFARTTSPFDGWLGEKGVSFGLSAGAGVLFGRQTVKNEVHMSSGSSAQFPEFSRSKQIAVPTVDASAQLNWAVPGSPLTLSAGYRYDGAYHVLDGGFATSNDINSVQHGPFLSLVWKLD